MKYFSYLCNREGFLAQKECHDKEGLFTLDHTVGSQFTRRGVSSGDYVYIIHLYRGELYLLSRLLVKKIVAPEAAAEYFGLSIEDMWSGSEHILADASPIYFDLVLTGE